MISSTSKSLERYGAFLWDQKTYLSCSHTHHIHSLSFLSLTTQQNSIADYFLSSCSDFNWGLRHYFIVYICFQLQNGKACISMQQNGFTPYHDFCYPLMCFYKWTTYIYINFFVNFMLLPFVVVYSSFGILLLCEERNLKEEEQSNEKKIHIKIFI